MSNTITTYTFSPGTKAKANEVNQNFDDVVSYMTNIADSTNNSLALMNSSLSEKADKNGSNSNTFNVASGNGNNNAVNNLSLNNKIYNSKLLIVGMKITKVSGQSRQIRISEGGCYDGSNYSIPINLTSELTGINLPDAGGGTGTTYNVFIKCDSNGDNVSTEITSSSTPSATYYRKIGVVYTNSDNAISNIDSYGIDYNNGFSNIAYSLIAPDYANTSAQQSVTTSSEYTVGNYGWIAQSATNISVNDNTLYDIVAFVKPGDIIKATTSTQKFYFIPCKGV